MALLSPTSDSEFLYTPVNSQAHQDRRILRELFPTNASAFAQFTVFRADQENAWTPSGIRLANQLHARALQVTATHGGETVRLADVCETGSTGLCSVRTALLDLLHS